MKKFASTDEYEAWAETVENPERYHSYIDDGFMLMVDMTTHCKSYKTAIRRFRKVYAELANVLTEDEFFEFDSWFDEMEANCECGYFEEAIRMANSVTKEELAEDAKNFAKNGGYWWGVEEVYEGCWYMYLNLSGEYLGRQPKEETTEEATTETVETETVKTETTETEKAETVETTRTARTTKTTVASVTMATTKSKMRRAANGKQPRLEEREINPGNCQVLESARAP